MWMQEMMVVCNNLLTARAVVVAKVNKVQFGVSKIDLFVRNVQSKSIWPVDFSINNCGSVSTIHTDPFNSWRFAPIRSVKHFYTCFFSLDGAAVKFS